MKGKLLLSLLIFLTCAAFFVINPVLSRSPLVDIEGRADSDFLKKVVFDMATNEVFRNFDNYERLNEVAEYLFKNLEGMGVNPQWQDYQVEGKVFKNIVVRFQGSGNKNLMIMGAHYDACYETPGADDNASGVAGLLELARLIERNKEKLPRPVELVFYTLEEPPFFRTTQMGSAIHARDLKSSGEKVDLMLSIEMIGRFSDEPGSQKYPNALIGFLYPDKGNFLGLIGRLGDWGITRRAKAVLQAKKGVPILSINAPTALPGVDYSDHLNYWANDLPALMFTDTAFLRNFDYHKLTDTADKLDYVRMAKAIDQLVLLPFEF